MSQYECEFCQDQPFEITKTGARRCVHCARGARLKEADDLRKNPPAAKPAPTLSTVDAEGIIEMLGTIRMFPANPVVRSVIGGEIRNLCSTVEDGVWLADRMIKLYREWPGLPELRIVYCTRKVPHDRELSTMASEVYPDGIPAELPTPEPERLQLPAGAVSADPKLEAAVHKLAEELSMPSPFELDRRRAAETRRTRGVASPTNPNFQPVTQADIDLAVQILRDRKAKEESGL